MGSISVEENILVTGGAGFIGTHTVVQLLNDGFRVTVIDNLDNSVQEAVNRVREVVGAKLSNKLEFHLGDLRSKDDLDKLFSQTKFDAVIHFAGLKAVGESVANPRRYFDNNLVGTINLYEVMAKYGCKKMVFSSSATVYGQPEKIPCVEDFELKAMNPYGRTKLFLEEIARDIQKAEPEWRIILLRYFNPVGAHESGKLGEDPKGIPNNLMPYIQQVAVGRLPELNVYGHDYPTKDGSAVNWDEFSIEPLCSQPFSVGPLEGQSEILVDNFERPEENFSMPSESQGTTGEDWSSHFQNLVFASLEATKDWLRQKGRELHMAIIVGRSDFAQGRSPRVWFICERGGSYRPKKKKIQPSPVVPVEKSGTKSLAVKRTGTKKCNCPFMLKAINLNGWEVSVVCGKHNHELSQYVQGHVVHGKLKPDERELFAIMSNNGVKPKTCLAALRSRDPENTTSLQHLYNVKRNLIDVQLDGRTVLQEMMKLSAERNYVINDRRDPETHVVKNLFFTHPESIALTRAFPYVMIMDSTYKTNMHKWPLFEIVGVTSTFRTFSVAFCFMEHETEDDYRWALERLREIMGDDRKPVTIVTDRELALMNAIDAVFPEATHLLCRWHIKMGVQKKGKAVLPKEEDAPIKGLKDILQGAWDLVVYSKTVQEYEENLASFKQHFTEYPSLVSYVLDEWIPYREKFMCAWTNNILHLDNTQTTRAEGAHSSLKDFLRSSSKNSFLTIFERIHSSVDVQISEIKSTFTASLNVCPHEHKTAILKPLKGYVSNYCLGLLEDECTVLARGYNTPDLCECVKFSTHGIPCACRIGKIKEKGLTVHLSDVHEFWKKLSVRPEPVDVGDDIELREELNLVIVRYKNAAQHIRKDIIRRLRDIAYPQSTWLATPPNPVRGKGRPPKKKSKGEWTTKREPSAFEIEEPTNPTRPPGQHYFPPRSNSTTASGRVLSIAPNRSRKTQKKKITDMDRLKQHIPGGWEPFVEDITDVIGDGHCGFRAVAKCLGFSDYDGWKKVRQDCIDELDAHREVYATMFGDEEYRAKLRRTLDCFEVPAKPKCWMAMPYTGYVIASRYSVVYVSLSNISNLTFTPQFTRPPIDLNHELGREIPLISTMLIDAMVHYVSLKLVEYPPLPPPTTFSKKFTQSYAQGWDELLRPHNEYFCNIFAGDDRLHPDAGTVVCPIDLTDAEDEDEDKGKDKGKEKRKTKAKTIEKVQDRAQPSNPPHWYNAYV